MIKTIDALTKRLKKIEDEIPKLISDVALEQVENNKVLDELNDELVIYETILHDILKDKILYVIPSNEQSSIKELYDESEEYRSIIKMLGKDEEFIERFGFDRTIYDIGHAESVDQANKSLRDFIQDMHEIGIELCYENFNYSTFTLKYMKYFFANNDENYLFSMKKYFDNIYWECPLLLTHLELCVRNLILSNKRSIVKHINHLLAKKLTKVHSNKNDIINRYVKTRKQYEEMLMADPYNIYEYFKENRASLDNYYPQTPAFDKILSCFIEPTEYYSLSNEKRAYFFNNLNELYFSLKEYEIVEKFSKVFSYLQDIYLTKVVAKGEYKNKLKEINKLEREKTRLDKKVEFFLKKREKLDINEKEKINGINAIIKEINNDVAKKVALIKIGIDESVFIRFQEMLSNALNDATSIYETAVFFSRYYSILYNQISNDKQIPEDKILEYVDDFRHIQYNPNLTILKKVSFLEKDSLKDLIEKKFMLSNINISIPNIDSSEYEQIINNLEILRRYNNIEMYQMSLEDIEVALKMDDKN